LLIIEDLLVFEVCGLCTALSSIVSPLGIGDQVLDFLMLDFRHILPIAGVVNGVVVFLNSIP